MLTRFGTFLVELILVVCIGYSFGLVTGVAFGLGCIVEYLLEWTN